MFLFSPCFQGRKNRTQISLRYLANLTPQRAATIIAETGDPIAAPFNGRIANETRAVERVRRERTAGGAAATNNTVAR